MRKRAEFIQSLLYFFNRLHCFNREYVFWQAQVEAQKSAAKFQHANGLYRAAKETVALAEESLLRSDDRGKIVLDTAWQDMLNHATAKVKNFSLYYRNNMYIWYNVLACAQKIYLHNYEKHYAARGPWITECACYIFSLDDVEGIYRRLYITFNFICICL